MLRSTLVLNIGKLNENRKPARCQLFTRGCLFGRLSMTTCKCKTSFDGELLLALSKLATHPPFMGQCKHAITISSLSLSASNLPIQSTRDKSSSMGPSWSIVPRRRDFQLVDSENSWLLLSAWSQSVSGTHSAQLTLEIPRISDWKPFSFPTKRSLRVHTVDLKAETIWGDAMSYPPILRKR